MLTQPLPLFVESPEGLGQDTLINRSANVPGAGSSMTPHSSASQKDVLQTGGSPLLSCMFCDETLTQDELGPHVLTQHPTTVFEPTVLCIEAEFRIPAEGAWPKPVVLPLKKEEVFSCVVCGQVSQDASELETHMRKHKDYFTYGCNVCGRRFKESWFLKSHMKKHGTKPGARSKIQQDHETPVAVNGVIQDQTPEPVATVYKMCMVCGFFFPDQESLVEHSKVHNREIEPRNNEIQDASTESLGDQITFLQKISLRQRCDGDNMQPERASRSIAQLDPFTTYQAWQLATKGKVAVGPNNAKDLGQEASTDNEESGSDKEELSNIWSEGQGDKPGRELRSQQHTAMESSSPEPDQKSLIRKDKERPTHCEDCGRTFRTYHQLVLHSRVHKKERTGEESPTASTDGKMPRPGSLDRAEESFEDSFEDRPGAETLGSDGAERSKVKGIVLKECSYCGKAFRSSYYLNIHLRVHTGEKPFKCVYCDYAAAQKTSLKYHLERRHKDKSSTDIPSQPLPFMPSPDEKELLNNNKKTASSRSKLWVPGPRSGASGNPEDRFNSIGDKLAKPLAQLNAEYEKVIAKTAYSPADDGHIKCPMPVNLKMERKEIKEESFEAPLNLSLKVSLSISPSPEPRNVSIPIACSSCTYKTLYPEVLIMHTKLIHKDKSDMTKKNGCRGSLKRTRSTNCPPALNGKDVTPLSMFDGRHPRRTKSPTREPTKSQEKDPSSNPPPAPKQSPVRVSRPGAVQETRQYKTGTEPHVNQASSRYPESVKESSSRYLMGRLGPTDRVGIGEMSYAVRGGVSWPSYATGLGLSNRFESLPHMDLGEPSIKRLKYSMPPGMETDTFDKPGFRVPAKDGSNRMLIRITPSPQGSFPAKIPEVFGPGNTTNSPAASSIDRDWNMMNILRSYSPSDLASFYHGSSANSSHGGLANPRPGNRTTLYQQLPALPNLTRRDHSGTDLNECQGTTDKTT